MWLNYAYNPYFRLSFKLRSEEQRRRLKSFPLPSRVGAALLLFAAHALFVSATHFHRVAPVRSAFSQVGVSAGGNSQADKSGGVGHLQCPLCRLQRADSSGLEGRTPVAAAPNAKAIRGETSQFPAYANDARLRRAGRAPPTLL